MARTLALLVVLASTLSTTLGAPPVHAEPSTEDERAGLCASFQGVAFTFCVALCEARECDRLAASDPRCTLLRRGFTRVTGASPPCDAGALANASRAPGS